MNDILTSSFFNRPALEVAPDLLGKYLIKKEGSSKHQLLITEVEAYEGVEDLASHARFGKTQRNAVMFGPAGVFYMYLIYGMYWMLNVVVDEVDRPSALLIRGTREVSGPGRLTKHLSLNKGWNEKEAHPSTGLWFEDHGFRFSQEKIQRSPRIGVDYAAEWALKPYRFLLNTNE